MGEELSLYTFLIVHGFMKIMYYLGNDKNENEKNLLEHAVVCMKCCSEHMLFTLSPIFSLPQILWRSYAE